jgi:type IV secretion system protein VirD4
LSIAKHTLALVTSSAIALFAGTNAAAFWFYHYNYRGLGEPFFVSEYTGGLYEPWMLVQWWIWWGDSFAGLQIGAVVAALVFPFVLYAWYHDSFSGWFDRKPKVGTEKEWGTEDDYRAHKLLNGRGLGRLGGIVLGRLRNNRLVTHESDEHVLVSGRSGIGKSASVVIPSLLSWLGSVLVIDTKRELYAVTANYRSTLGRVAYFDPADEDSVCFNPLLEIPIGTNREISYIQNICEIITESRADSTTAASIHYQERCKELLTGLILHAIHDREPCDLSFGWITKSLSSLPLKDMFKSSNEEVRRVAVSFMNQPADKMASVLSSMSNLLAVFKPDLVCEKTSVSDFKISDIVCDDKPMSLFIQVRPTDKERLRPLTRMISDLFLMALIHDERKMPDGRKKKHKLLLVEEEFPFQGKRDVVANNLLVMRSYGVTAMLITQSIKELRRVYGDKQTIDTNCKVVIGFSSIEEDEQAYFSRNAGTTTVEKESISKRASWGFTGHESTKTVREERKPLLGKEQVRGLPEDRQIVIVAGCSSPFLPYQVRWFKHPVFRKLGTHVQRHVGGPGEEPPGQAEWVLEKLSERDLERMEREKAGAASVPAEVSPHAHFVKPVMLDKPRGGNGAFGNVPQPGQEHLALIMGKTGWSEAELSEHVFGDAKAAKYVERWLQPGVSMPWFRFDMAKMVADHVRGMDEGADVVAALLREHGNSTVVDCLRRGVPVD